MGKHGAGWWRYEQTAYYTDGILRLGYATGDEALIKKGEAGIDYTLDHASKKGYLGDECLWNRKKHKVVRGMEMWPMVVFFRAMKAKYDATGDGRIPAALAKYYRLYSSKAVSLSRNTISVEGMLWTYGKTGDAKLLELAEQAWLRKVAVNDWSGDITPAKCESDEPLFLHGASYCEELKIPLILYAYTGKKEYLNQAVNVERKLVRDHILPDGCPESTEHVRGNSVYWGHETCDVSDYSWSLGYFLETTGDASYADKIERCVYNAAFGAVADDFPPVLLQPQPVHLHVQFRPQSTQVRDDVDAVPPHARDGMLRRTNQPHRSELHFAHVAHGRRRPPRRRIVRSLQG